MARKSADPAVNGKGHPPRRSEQFLAGLAQAERVTFVSHVNPDPDSLGSMMGLAHLVSTRLGIPTRLTQDGFIGRAENRAMVELLGLRLEPIEEVTLRPSEALVMVDSQPNTGRHNFDPDLPLYAVIDHHETGGDLDGVRFTDVRQKVGATCSVVTTYLMEQEIEPPTDVATALLYGIETETGGYPREASALDERALNYLSPLVDRDILSRIRNARLPVRYFECMLHALQNCFIYDRMIVSWVNELPQPELAAEVVDFLIRFEEIDWAVCAGVHQDKLVLSVRSALSGVHAGDMLQKVVGRLGKAGGHDRRAGGCIPLVSTSANAIEQLQATLRRRLLKALKIDECRGQRLVPRRELLSNLQA